MASHVGHRLLGMSRSFPGRELREGNSRQRRIACAKVQRCARTWEDMSVYGFKILFMSLFSFGKEKLYV